MATNAKRFSGQTVMVTGAAGGLGASMAHGFAKEGATVVVTGRKEKPGLELARAIGGEAFFVALDVTDEASWQNAIAASEDKRGPLSVLINNAAYLAVGGVETVPLAEWRAVIDTNLTGAFLGIRAAAPSMRKGGGGSSIRRSPMTPRRVSSSSRSMISPSREWRASRRSRPTFCSSPQTMQRSPRAPSSSPTGALGSAPSFNPDDRTLRGCPAARADHNSGVTT